MCNLEEYEFICEILFFAAGDKLFQLKPCKICDILQNAIGLCRAGAVRAADANKDKSGRISR